MQVTDEGQPVLPKLSVLGCSRKVEVEQWARENLQPGTTVNMEGLVCFHGVEAAGREHKPRMTVYGFRAAARMRASPR